MTENETPLIRMPKLYNVFDMPDVKAIRAATSLRSKVNLEDVLKRASNVRKVRSANKDVVKFEVRRKSYLLLFPSGYVEIHAPNDESIRAVLIAFRNELYECGLIE